MRHKPSIAITLPGLEMENPTMIASGVLGLSSKVFYESLDNGAGAIVTKSVSLNPIEGYRNPTFVAVPYGYLNAIGLSNPGASAFLDELSLLKKNTPIVVSLFADSSSNFKRLAEIMDESCAKAYELNLSCPHVKKGGFEIGHKPKLVNEIVNIVSSATKRPIYVKISPNVSDPVEIAKAAEKGGAAAITATNTIRGMAIDVETGVPILTNKVGGLSGPALKPIALRCVYEISKNIDIPVIGCGGISNWKDAVEYLMAGASAVQIGSAIANYGTSVFNQISEGLRHYLEEKRYRSVSELIGLSHKI